MGASGLEWFRGCTAAFHATGPTEGSYIVSPRGRWERLAQPGGSSVELRNTSRGIALLNRVLCVSDASHGCPRLGFGTNNSGAEEDPQGCLGPRVPLIETLRASLGDHHSE